METYIALLRGINVGGKNKIAMADLRAMATDMGSTNARTILQSGNLLFDGEFSTARAETDLSAAVEKRCGIKLDFFVRTPEQWNDLILNNPFPEEAVSDPSHLVVVLLKTPSDSKEVQTVQTAMSGPERMAEVDGTLYIVYPEGIGNSKVSRTPGWNRLVSRGTARNWNTVLKIQAAITSKLA